MQTGKPRDVVVVVSQPTAGGERNFALDPVSPEEAPEPPAHLRHESELIAWMKEKGLQLTMIGGGAGGEEVRRFYFRPRAEGD